MVHRIVGGDRQPSRLMNPSDDLVEGDSPVVAVAAARAAVAGGDDIVDRAGRRRLREDSKNVDPAARGDLHTGKDDDPSRGEGLGEPVGLGGVMVGDRDHRDVGIDGGLRQRLVVGGGGAPLVPLSCRPKYAYGFTCNATLKRCRPGRASANRKTFGGGAAAMDLSLESAR